MYTSSMIENEEGAKLAYSPQTVVNILIFNRSCTRNNKTVNNKIKIGMGMGMVSFTFTQILQEYTSVCV